MGSVRGHHPQGRNLEGQTPQAQLSFLMRAAYDTLTCPQNLSQWFGAEEKCHKISAGLKHILSSYEVALTQGHLRWQRNQVLQKLAEHLEECRIATNTFSNDKIPGVPFCQISREPAEASGRPSKIAADPWKGMGDVFGPRRADDPETSHRDVAHSC